MNREQELKRARRIEAATNTRIVEHYTTCGPCWDAVMQGDPGEGECGTLDLLMDQAQVAADAVDELAAELKEVN